MTAPVQVLAGMLTQTEFRHIRDPYLALLSLTFVCVSTGLSLFIVDPNRLYFRINKSIVAGQSVNELAFLLGTSFSPSLPLCLVPVA